MLKKSLLALAIATAFAPGIASAQNALATEGPWLLRVRAAYMINDNSNSPALAGGQVEVDDKLIPEFDISYFFTDNIAMELVLTWPQKMDVMVSGYQIATVDALPPSLMLQYHFMPNDAFRPYVGVGINYTRFSDLQSNLNLSVSNSSWGAALQAGFDYRIAPRWYLNVDAKYIWMDTEVKLAGVPLTTVDINPWLLSVGVGYRF